MQFSGAGDGRLGDLFVQLFLGLSLPPSGAGGPPLWLLLAGLPGASLAGAVGADAGRVSPPVTALLGASASALWPGPRGKGGFSPRGGRRSAGSGRRSSLVWP